MTRPRTASPRFAAAFSMIELVVVIILLAIFAGVALPRLAGGRERRAEVEARAVAGLLSALAQREALSGRGVALECDEAAGRVSLLVAAEGSADGWATLPLVNAVQLDAARVSRVLVDGGALPANPAGSLRVAMPAGVPRPGIDVLIEMAGARAGETGRAWQVSLEPGAAGALVVRLADAGAFAARAGGAVDLDAVGRRAEPW